MSGRKLSIGELLEGALAVLLARPFAVGLFILADASAAYALFWAEAQYGLGLAGIIGGSLISYAIISSLLICALADRLRQVLADPAELCVRLVFVLAASLVVAVGSGLALLLLIVPGLYVMARWAIVAPLILLEGAGIGTALGRSSELTESSAWALVAVSVVIYVPQGLLGFFGTAEIGNELLRPTAGVVLQLIITACFVAFEVAVIVFAHRELSPPRNELSDIFA